MRRLNNYLGVPYTTEETIYGWIYTVYNEQLDWVCKNGGFKSEEFAEMACRDWIRKNLKKPP